MNFDLYKDVSTVRELGLTFSQLKYIIRDMYKQTETTKGMFVLVRFDITNRKKLIQYLDLVGPTTNPKDSKSIAEYVAGLPKELEQNGKLAEIDFKFARYKGKKYTLKELEILSLII